jgi:hypothetical protein
MLEARMSESMVQEGQVFDRALCYYLGRRYGKYVHPVRVSLTLKGNLKESTRILSKEVTSALDNMGMDSVVEQIVRSVVLSAGDAV